MFCPLRLLGLGTLVNRILPVVPLLRRLSLVSVAVLRPIIPSPVSGLSSSSRPATSEATSRTL